MTERAQGGTAPMDPIDRLRDEIARRELLTAPLADDGMGDCSSGEPGAGEADVVGLARTNAGAPTPS
jgi:hypothetical protein